MGRAKCFSRKLSTLFLGLCLALGLGTGCGYSFQSFKHSEELEKEGIHKVYIAPPVNNTYKTGVQNVVYNALIRSLVNYDVVRIVQSRQDADAVLNIVVNEADSQVVSSTHAKDLFPSSAASQLNLGGTNPPIATVYQAVLSCSFNLVRRNPEPGQNAVIWGSNFTRSKPYPGSNQLGPLGTTSPLINDSEFDRTLLDIAQSMMVDVREAIFTRF